MFAFRKTSRLAMLFLLTLVPAHAVLASDAARLLPADTEFIVTVNVKQFLGDHKNTKFVRDWLEQLGRTAKKEDLGFDPGKDLSYLTCGIKSDKEGFLILLVEGQFQKKGLRFLVKQLASGNGFSFKTAKVGGQEVWLVDNGFDEIQFLLLNNKCLAITSGQNAMQNLIARAAGKRADGLSTGTGTLLESGQKEHLALVINQADRRLSEAVQFLQEEMVKQWNVKGGIAKLVADQITSGIQKHAKEFTAAGIGLTFGQEELNLRLDLETKSPKLAKELRGAINDWNFFTALALKAMNHELTNPLGDIILKEQVTVQNGTLTIKIQVPYEFIQRAMQYLEQADQLVVQAKAGNGGPVSSAALRHALVETVMRRVTSIPIWRLPKPLPPGSLEFDEEFDLPYHNGPTANYFRHRLDLFVPKGKKDFPVVVLVHGGGWTLGDNRACGLYTSVGQFLATQGIGVVLPNYRLSPLVKHPEHVKDVARAVAWTHKNIAKYGGNPKRLYLLGHSAGGHLVSLLATDESYLKAEGLKTSDLKGVIASSGLYNIPPGKFEVTLGGPGAKAAWLDQMLPLRGYSGSSLGLLFPGIPLAVDVYGPAFGADATDRTNASPLKHVRPGLPPFLLLSAERDWPHLVDMAVAFEEALTCEGCDARWLKIARRNHNSLLFSAIHPDDPAAKAILEFVRTK